MITHEQARKELKQILLSKIDVLYDYVKQQEKKDILYGRLFKVCQEYKHTSIGLSDDSEFLNTLNELENLDKYINDQQAKDKVHEELVRDVKRYFELDNKHGCTLRDIDEWLDLERKLMKVGKKE